MRGAETWGGVAWISALPGFWQMVAAPPLAQVRMSAADALGAVVITAAVAPAINSGAIKRALMFIIEIPILSIARRCAVAYNIQCMNTRTHTPVFHIERK
jgi:hypothetical protein